MKTLFALMFLVLAFCSCYTGSKKPETTQKKKASFAFRETIVKGKDTGLINLAGFKRKNNTDIFCQHWTMTGVSSAKFGMQEVSENEDIAELFFFKDSTFLENPRFEFQTGKWSMEPENRLLIAVDTGTREAIVKELTSKKLVLAVKEGNETLTLHFAGDTKVHQQMHSDPFHPINNQWRIKPKHSENDSAIRSRVKNCVLFFALYYRDHIKRGAEEISFAGLPDLFNWYSGGIGLPDKEDIHESWINCFYNQQQAEKGYAILRRLIVDYEYEWLRGTPSWVYETQAVLEQMYHKIDSLNIAAQAKK